MAGLRNDRNLSCESWNSWGWWTVGQWQVPSPCQIVSRCPCLRWPRRDISRRLLRPSSSSSSSFFSVGTDVESVWSFWLRYLSPSTRYKYRAIFCTGSERADSRVTLPLASCIYQSALMAIPRSFTHSLVHFVSSTFYCHAYARSVHSQRRTHPMLINRSEIRERITDFARAYDHNLHAQLFPQIRYIVRILHMRYSI